MNSFSHKSLIASCAAVVTSIFLQSCTVSDGGAGQGVNTRVTPTVVSIEDKDFKEAVQYHLGEGVAPDIPKAVSLYEKLVARGNTSAMKNLAAIMYDGKGVERDTKRAFELYQQAADKGDVGALTSLAGMYLDGDAVPQNYAEARRLYMQAAAQGYPYAQEGVGTIYLFGWGVDTNKIEAYAWFSLASKGGDNLATENLQKLTASLTSDEIEAGKKRANQLSDKQ